MSSHSPTEHESRCTDEFVVSGTENKKPLVLMGYRLGVDLGTTYSAAAVARGDRVAMATLGLRTPEIPSVIAFTGEGEVLIGDAAVRRALVEPERIAREFKRRIGNPVPIIIGGVPRSPESLMAMLLREIVDRVSAAEGGPPSDIVVTHPAGWGPYKTSQLEQIFQMADQQHVTVISEPEAAARHYVAQGRLPADSVVAVFDFGGGTFDASVIRAVDGKCEILGESLGLERLGGVDLDQALFAHVLNVADVDLTMMTDDDAHRTALARLRLDCVAAKEALSADTTASVSVLLPGQHVDVRLVRTEFEDMIRPSIEQSIAALEQAVTGAGIEVADLGSVLLVGGSSRVPLVSQMIRDRLDCPVLVDAHPKHAVAMGAALPDVDSRAVEHTPEVIAPESPTPVVVAPAPPATDGTAPAWTRPTSETEPVPADTISETVVSTSAISREGWLRRGLIGAGVLAAIALGVVLAMTGPEADVADVSTAGASEASASTAASTTEVAPPITEAPSSTTSAGPTTEPPLQRQELVASLMTGASGWTGTGFMGHNRMLPGDGPLQPPRLLWQLAVDSLVGPVTSDGRAIFAVRPDGELPVLAAADITSGESLWTTSRFTSGAVLVTDTLLVALVADEIRFHDPETGDVILTMPLPEEAGEDATMIGADLTDGTILTAGSQRGGGGVAWASSIDVVTGSANWTVTDDSLGLNSADTFMTFGTDGETILLAGPTALVALDAASGLELWRSVDQNSRTLLHIDAGVMLHQPATGVNRGTDARTGTTLWTYEQSSTAQWSSDGTNFFVMAGQDEVQARRLATGDLLWAGEGAFVIGPPPLLIVGNEAVYMVHVSGEAAAFRRTSGQLIWSANLEGAQPQVSGQLPLFIGDGRLLVLQEGVLRVYE